MSYLKTEKSRELFESVFYVPDDAVWSDVYRSYVKAKNKEKLHKISESYDAWAEAWDIQQAIINDLDKAIKNVREAAFTVAKNPKKDGILYLAIQNIPEIE